MKDNVKKYLNNLIIGLFCCLTASITFGCKNRFKSAKEETTDSISTQADIIMQERYVEIPRTHFDVSLGMSLDEVKSVFSKNGCDIEDHFEVNIIEGFPLVTCISPYWGKIPDQAPQDWKDKYLEFDMTFYNNLLASVKILPVSKDQLLVKDKLLEKYPFEIETNEVPQYKYGVASIRKYNWYRYSDGVTRIAMSDYNSYLTYEDVKLTKEMSEYKDRIRKENEHTESSKIEERVMNDY